MSSTLRTYNPLTYLFKKIRQLFQWAFPAKTSPVFQCQQALNGYTEQLTQYSMYPQDQTTKQVLVKLNEKISNKLQPLLDATNKYPQHKRLTDEALHLRIRVNSAIEALEEKLDQRYQQEKDLEDTLTRMQNAVTLIDKINFDGSISLNKQLADYYQTLHEKFQFIRDDKAAQELTANAPKLHALHAELVAAFAVNREFFPKDLNPEQKDPATALENAEKIIKELEAKIAGLGNSFPPEKPPLKITDQRNDLYFHKLLGKLEKFLELNTSAESTKTFLESLKSTLQDNDYKRLFQQTITNAEKDLTNKELGAKHTVEKTATPSPAKSNTQPLVSEETNSSIRNMFMNKNKNTFYNPAKNTVTNFSDSSSESDLEQKNTIKPAWMAADYQPKTLSGEAYVKEIVKASAGANEEKGVEKTATPSPAKVENAIPPPLKVKNDLGEDVSVLDVTVIKPETKGGVPKIDFSNLRDDEIRHLCTTGFIRYPDGRNILAATLTYLSDTKLREICENGTLEYHTLFKFPSFSTNRAFDEEMGEEELVFTYHHADKKSQLAMLKKYPDLLDILQKDERQDQTLMYYLKQRENAPVKLTLDDAGILDFTDVSKSTLKERFTTLYNLALDYRSNIVKRDEEILTLKHELGVAKDNLETAINEKYIIKNSKEKDFLKIMRQYQLLEKQSALLSEQVVHYKTANDVLIRDLQATEGYTKDLKNVGPDITMEKLTGESIEKPLTVPTKEEVIAQKNAQAESEKSLLSGPQISQVTKDTTLGFVSKSYGYGTTKLAKVLHDVAQKYTAEQAFFRLNNAVLQLYAKHKTLLSYVQILVAEFYNSFLQYKDLCLNIENIFEKIRQMEKDVAYADEVFKEKSAFVVLHAPKHNTPDMVASRNAALQNQLDAKNALEKKKKILKDLLEEKQMLETRRASLAYHNKTYVLLRFENAREFWNKSDIEMLNICEEYGLDIEGRYVVHEENTKRFFREFEVFCEQESAAYEEIRKIIGSGTETLRRSNSEDLSLFTKKIGTGPGSPIEHTQSVSLPVTRAPTPTQKPTPSIWGDSSADNALYYLSPATAKKNFMSERFKRPLENPINRIKKNAPVFSEGIVGKLAKKKFYESDKSNSASENSSRNSSKQNSPAISRSSSIANISTAQIIIKSTDINAAPLVEPEPLTKQSSPKNLGVKQPTTHSESLVTPVAIRPQPQPIASSPPTVITPVLEPKTIAQAAKSTDINAAPLVTVD